MIIDIQALLMIGLSYKQKCNNFGYLSIQMWLKGNDNLDKGQIFRFQIGIPIMT